jgi:hypothetical protein
MYSLTEEIFFNENAKRFDELIEIIKINHAHHMAVALANGGYIRKGAIENARKLVHELDLLVYGKDSLPRGRHEITTLDS